MTELATPPAVSGPALDAAASEALVDLVVRGMVRGELSAALAGLMDAGLAMRKGPIVMPTLAGSAAAATATRLPVGSDVEQQVRSCFHVFLPVNRRLRDLCTAWQCTAAGTPNDHSDAAYDAGVRDDLDDVHDDVLRIVGRVGRLVPSVAGYGGALTAALAAFDAGDLAMLTSPIRESYHTVWMQLHQQLLLLLGVSRAEDEALEQQLVAAENG